VQRRTEHDAIFAQRLASDDDRKLHHEPGPDITPSKAKLSKISMRSGSVTASVDT